MLDYSSSEDEQQIQPTKVVKTNNNKIQKKLQKL